MLGTQDRAKRLCDLARREGAGGDLVQQRLEEMEIAPIDEGHVEARVVAQVLGGVQAAEPAADDDDAVRCREHGAGCGQTLGDAFGLGHRARSDAAGARPTGGTVVRADRRSSRSRTRASVER